MKYYPLAERKVSGKQKEPAIVYTAPYFEKENYTYLGKFLRARNENAELSAAGSLSVLPSTFINPDYLQIANNTNMLNTALQNAAIFFAQRMDWTQRTMPASAGWRVIAWNGTVFCAIAYDSSVSATGLVSTTERYIETPTEITLPANHSFYVKVK